MISVGDYLDRVLALVGQLGIESVELPEARGRCLAEPVRAAVPVPPWTNSAMDGYAVRHDDLLGAGEDSPVSLRLVAEIPAGSGEDPAIGPGEAARIMTGAPLPSDADTVIPQELTDGGTELVEIKSCLTRGRHVRLAGEDRETGAEIAAAGTELTPEAVAAIASAGVASVRAFTRPRLATISTGDELVPPGSELRRGQIPDSNSLLISLIAGDAGAVAVTDHAGDGPGELEAVIERLRDSHDVIVITGGVSVGAHDPVKALFEGRGEVLFDRVAMQPGKPQAFGRLGEDGPLVFGLPGNPVSAWVSFQMFVRPALRKLQGFSTLLPDSVPARAAGSWRTPSGRAQVIPVRISDGERREVLPAASGGSGSHLAASLANADGFALVAAEVEEVRIGDTVQSVRLRDAEQFNRRQRSRS